VKEQYNPAILDKVMQEISRRYQHKQTFTDESLKHIYGESGDKLVHWK
jgi:hypothetical protein